MLSIFLAFDILHLYSFAACFSVSSMTDAGGVWDANELALTAVLTVLMQLSCFLIAFACQFDKITDLAGSSNFIINAVLTLVLNGTFFTRQVHIILVSIA